MEENDFMTGRALAKKLFNSFHVGKVKVAHPPGEEVQFADFVQHQGYLIARYDDPIVRAAGVEIHARSLKHNLEQPRIQRIPTLAVRMLVRREGRRFAQVINLEVPNANAQFQGVFESIEIGHLPVEFAEFVDEVFRSAVLVVQGPTLSEQQTRALWGDEKIRPIVRSTTALK
jgi:hypothetical protein